MLRNIWRQLLTRGHKRTPRATDAVKRARTFHPRLESLEDRCLLATFTVTTVAGSGAGSLRKAINDANLDDVADVIQFNIPNPGVQTIALSSPLPAITNPVLLDAFSQPGASPNGLAVGNNAVTLIQLDGAGAGAGANGLELSASNSTIRGLAITRFAGHGILLTGGATGNVILGNVIGTGPAGGPGLGNGGDGIRIDGAFSNTIGGDTPSARNVISGNAGQGIGVVDHLKNNAGFTPGTLEPGGMTLTQAGIAAGFTLSTFASNLPFTNSIGPFGILPTDSGGVLVSDRAGDVRLFTKNIDNQLPTPQFVSNTVSYGASNSAGLAKVNSAYYLARQTSGDVIQIDSNGALVSTIVTGIPRALGLTANPVNGHLYVSTGINGQIYDINPATKTKSLFVARTDDIDGLSVSSDGKSLYAAIRNLNDGTDRIFVYNIATKAATDLGVVDRVDGTAFGTGALAGYLYANTNNGDVVQVNLANLNEKITIAAGGSRGDFVTVDPTTGTLLLTQTDRIERLTPLFGADFSAASTTYGNVIQGNYIGTNPAGSTALANGQNGVAILDGAFNNSVGGSNVISGNVLSGVLVSGQATTGNQVLGNLIGTDAAGLVALGNGGHGVAVANGAANTRIVQGNTISSNGLSGVHILGAATTGALITGNFIGTNAAGTAALGNGALGSATNDNHGIDIVGASNNSIGGGNSAQANAIAGNKGHGILIQSAASGNVVQGNWIGTNSTNASGLGNVGDGIRIDASSSNTIGGLPNTISGNQGNGILLGDDGAARLTASPGTSQAGPLRLTSQATAAGFTLSTFASGFTPNGSAIGPLGIAVTESGGVLVSDASGLVRLFGADVDNQTTSAPFVTQTTPYAGNSNAQGLVRVGASFYMAQAESGAVVELNSDGSLLRTVVGGMTGAAGLAANPLDGHLFVSVPASNRLYEVDPVAGTKTLFASAADPHGMAVSRDGRTLYVAVRNFLLTGPHVIGYDIASRRLTSFRAGPITGLNGLALGSGSLAGFLFANTSDGKVLQINLADPTQQTVLATGGSRGDYLAVDPLTRTLLVTQSDRILRLVPPALAAFGGNTFGNVIQNNRIGVNSLGTAALGNVQDGIAVRASAFFNVIGPGNVISANGQEGIEFSDAGTNGNAIQGNIIGLNAAGSAGLGNGRNGIAFANGAAGNTVGGTTATDRNMISANFDNGILISGASSTGQVVAGNSIGCDVTAALPLGNGANGILIDGAQGAAIGGKDVSAGNTIAFNALQGIVLRSNAVASIRRNAVFANVGGSIDAGNSASQAAPTLTSATTATNTTFVKGTVSGKPASALELDFFTSPTGGVGAGGQSYLTTATLTTDANGNASFTVDLKTLVQAGLFLTATTTAVSTGATSTFSSSVAVTVNQAPSADAGGPYSIVEGAALALDASSTTDPEGDSTVFAWDVNGDGVFTDATGQKPTLTWSQLMPLGITDGPRTFQVAVRATDDRQNVSVSPRVALNITNAPPSVTITRSAPDGGAAISFTSSVIDPGAADSKAGFTYAWTATRGGTTVASATTADFSFTPDSNGVYFVSLTATDKDGGAATASQTATQLPGVLAIKPGSNVINEGDKTSIIVTRSGGSDGTVTVQLSFTIPAGLILKRQATAGADFQGAAVGVLVFNPGETEKTVAIPILADDLVEVTEDFLVSLRTPTGGAALGDVTSTTVSIVDKSLPVVADATPKTATLQLAGSGFGKSTEHYRDFVTKAYARFLNRTPDAVGINYWVTLMQLYETSQHAQGLRQEQIEAGFLASPEYLGRYGGPGEKWVRGIYADLLNREADSSGVNYWASLLAANVPQSQIALGFTTSLERLSNRIQDTYRTLLGRDADTPGLNYWVAIFQAGGTTEDINSGFVGSPEYYSKSDGAKGNPARWVREAYLDILFRPARANELTYWLAVLKT